MSTPHRVQFVAKWLLCASVACLVVLLVSVPAHPQENPTDSPAMDSPDKAEMKARLSQLKKLEIQLNVALNKPNLSESETQIILLQLQSVHDEMDSIEKELSRSNLPVFDVDLKSMDMEDWKIFLFQYRFWLMGGLGILIVLLVLRWMFLEWLRQRRPAEDQAQTSSSSFSTLSIPAVRGQTATMEAAESSGTTAQVLQADAGQPVPLRDFQVYIERFYETEGGMAARKTVVFILEQGLLWNASDIHFNPENEHTSIGFRIDGVLQQLATIDHERYRKLVNVLKVLANLVHYESRAAQDGRIMLNANGRTIEFRVATIPVLLGERVIMRVVDTVSTEYDLDRLGLSSGTLGELKKIAQRRDGVMLLVGPIGSGKTTTLYALLKWIRQTMPGTSIATLEDPIEHALPGVAQVQVNVAKGLTYTQGFTNLLRHDTQVVLISEIRNLELAKLVMQAGHTAQLVFSTIHSATTEGAVDRLLDMGVEPYVLFNAVKAIQAQRLVPHNCPHCRETYLPPSDLLERAGEVVDINRAVWQHSVGCDLCGGTGIKGRVVIDELLRLDDPSLLQTITNRAERLERLRSIKPHTLWEDGVRKAFEGETTLEAVAQATMI